MKEAGVRELKTHLSEYLRGVKKGERIIVTDRNEKVAQIIPIRTYKGNKKREKIYDLLSKLAKRGLILPPQRWGKPQRHPKRIQIKGTQFSDAVIETRR